MKEKQAKQQKVWTELNTVISLSFYPQEFTMQMLAPLLRWL